MATKKKAPALGLQHLPLGKLKPDPANVRASIRDGDLRELLASIKARGVLVPLTVRKDGKGFVIKMGHRRARAAKLAGLKVVPCVVVEDDGDAVGRGIDQVLENTARAALPPMDMARWLSRLKTTEKLSANEIAARLAEAGMKAMTKAEVDTLVRLVDLPDWAQQMVDAGELEASAAIPLLKLDGKPKALAAARSRLQNAVKWGGRASSEDAHLALRDGFDAIGTDLTATDSWCRNPVHFAWKTRCKGCEHLAQHGRSAWCLSRKLFEEHQQEAKDAGLLPGGKRPEKEAKRTKDGLLANDEQLQQEKEQARARTVGEKVRDYLHAYLARKLMATLANSEAATAYELILWAALKRPGAPSGARGAPGVWYGEPGADAARSQGVHGLENVLGQAEDSATFAAAAVQQLVTELPWREIHVLARHVYGTDLSTIWTLEHGFLDLFRKAELAHLAVQADLTPPEGKRTWADSMKTDQLKQAILDQAEALKVPPVLADLYGAAPEKPYRPWRPGDEEDEEEDAEIGARLRGEWDGEEGDE